MSSDQAYAGEYAEAMLGFNTVNRSVVASLAFLVYDILITFDDEICYIWPKRWPNHLKTLFFLTRYPPVVILLISVTELTPIFRLTTHQCLTIQSLQTITSSVVIALVDIILLLRVYAVYNDSRPVQWAATIGFVLEVTAMCVGLALGVPAEEVDADCHLVRVSPLLLINAGASVIFHTMLFLLTAYKFIIALRDRRSGRVRPILTLLMRDGTWAFFLIFFIMVGEVLLYVSVKGPESGLIWGWLITAFSCCGYRILLNLGHLSDVNSVNAESRSPGLQFTTYIH